MKNNSGGKNRSAFGAGYFLWSAIPGAAAFYLNYLTLLIYKPLFNGIMTAFGDYTLLLIFLLIGCAVSIIERKYAVLLFTGGILAATFIYLIYALLFPLGGIPDTGRYPLFYKVCTVILYVCMCSILPVSARNLIYIRNPSGFDELRKIIPIDGTRNPLWGSFHIIIGSIMILIPSIIPIYIDLPSITPLLFFGGTVIPPLIFIYLYYLIKTGKLYGITPGISEKATEMDGDVTLRRDGIFVFLRGLNGLIFITVLCGGGFSTLPDDTFVTVGYIIRFICGTIFYAFVAGTFRKITEPKKGTNNFLTELTIYTMMGGALLTVYYILSIKGGNLSGLESALPAALTGIAYGYVMDRIYGTEYSVHKKRESNRNPDKNRSGIRNGRIINYLKSQIPIFAAVTIVFILSIIGISLGGEDVIYLYAVGFWLCLAGGILTVASMLRHNGNIGRGSSENGEDEM